MKRAILRIPKFFPYSEARVCLLALTLGIVIAWNLRGDTAERGQVTFAQLTDAHIFDDGWKQPTPDALRQAANNRDALHWAIDQVNRAVAAGKTIDFVVYSGDLGLQNVAVSRGASCRALPVDPEPGLPQTTLAGAVKEIADELNELSVRRVFFVPGNNDIRNEEVTDERFECFIAALEKKVRSYARPIEVAALRANQAVDINGLRLAGLNSASFKNQNNYRDACSRPDPADTALQGACPKPQMDSLRTLTGGKAPLLLFTHVPDLLDPYLKRPSWNIPADVRKLWENEVCGPNIIAVFAGHFHDSNAGVYGRNGATKDCVPAKTWVAPPLALKNQEHVLVQARGFLIATVAKGGVANIELKWFNEPVLAAIQSGGSTQNLSTKTTAASRFPVFAFLALAAALVLGLAFSARNGSGASRVFFKEMKTFATVLAFVALTLAVVWYARNQLEITESAVLIALLLCPLLVYGVASGRLREFSGPGGWGAKFGQAAIDSGHLSDSRINVTIAEDIPKGGLPETQSKIQQIRTGKPVVLTMTLGAPAAPGGFQTYAVANALMNLAAYPNFKFVVFLEPGGRLISYVPGWLLRSGLNSNSPESAALIAATNAGNVNGVLEYPGMLTETVHRATTNLQALEAMEELETDAIPVIDQASGKMEGVVTRERIVSGMMLALLKGAND